MTTSGGRLVVRALEDEGIPFCFGIPGTHNIELYDALAESHTVRTVLVTDEQSAGFMADGVWRASGRMACANVVPGAGLTHALSGVAEAFMDTVPMLVLGCGIRRDTGRAFQLHDIDQQALVRPVTKAQFLPRTGEDLYGTIREACRVARSGAPGPVFVEVPADLYLLAHGGSDDSPPLVLPPPAADAAQVARAADLLAGARRPLVYAGMGAAGAADLLLELAQRLEAPVSTTFSGKGVFPESHPLALWPGFGDAAPPFARQVAGECDATIAIGCRFGEVATGSYGVHPPRPLIHVDIEPSVLGRNVQTDVPIVGDAAEVLRALLSALEQKPRNDGLRARIAAGRAAVRQEWAARRGARVSPWRLISALQQRIGPETIYATDSGNGTFIGMEMLQLTRPGQFLAPVDYSCMGYSVPAAIGAKLARPECGVVALVGDGAFLMTGLELLTATHEGVGAIFVVLRDRELAQIAQFQSVAMNRKTASELPDYDLGQLCAGLGVACLRLDTDDGIDRALEQAAAVAAQGRPVVVDCAIDYSEKTYFTRGVVKTNLARFPWRDRLRFIGRAITRKLTE